MRRGNCYVTVEALYHLLGGKISGWMPMNMKHEGDQHWFLKHRIYKIILDPTVDQFETYPDYSKARGRGFMTKRPSKRAKVLMKSMMWQE